MIKYRKPFITVTLVVLFLMACLINAKNAAGEDWKSVPGAMCSASIGYQEKYLRHWQIGTVNKHTKKVRVICPIIRDNLYSYNVGEVFVYINQYSLRTTQCWLRSVSAIGKKIHTIASSRQGSGYIVFGGTSLPLINGGIMSVECLLPPNARLVSISYDEKGGTNIDY